jgi:hypothetical protein
MSQNPGPNPDDVPDTVTEPDIDEVRAAELSDEEVSRSAPTQGTDQDPASYLHP